MSNKITFILTEKDIKVLKKALENYPKNKDITECLLSLINHQIQKGE